MCCTFIRCRHRFGTYGTGRGEFTNPHGFCLGMQEEVIVAGKEAARRISERNLFTRIAFCLSQQTRIIIAFRSSILTASCTISSAFPGATMASCGIRARSPFCVAPTRLSCATAARSARACSYLACRASFTRRSALALPISSPVLRRRAR